MPKQQEQTSTIIGSNLRGWNALAWLGAGSIATTAFLRSQRKNGSDIIWAVGLATLGGVLVYTLAGTREAGALNNLGVGMFAGSTSYLVAR